MAMLAEVAGTFCKIAFADAVDVVLARGLAGRPAARLAACTGMRMPEVLCTAIPIVRRSSQARCAHSRRR
jgi:hypothetical protein